MGIIDKALYGPYLDNRWNLFELDGLNIKQELKDTIRDQVKSVACLMDKNCLFGGKLVVTPSLSDRYSPPPPLAKV